MSLERKIARCIEPAGPISPGDHLVLAVSGGADSIAMLYALHALAPRFNLSLTVVHVNHGLRGEHSDSDAEFVTAVAQQLGLECFAERVDARNAAKRRVLLGHWIIVNNKIRNPDTGGFVRTFWRSLSLLGDQTPERPYIH